MPACPKCGSPVPADSPLAQCPVCLLSGGAALLSGHSAEASGIPDAGEIADVFPDLEILHLLGRGGMGAVYLARQPRLERLVALKVLPPSVADAEFEERFRREATLMARMNHPHIVTLYEYGEREGIFYLIMEYIDGEPLSERIRRGQVTPREALAFIPQICEALDYSHRAGVVHRDIKPANLLVNAGGTVKITDFGVARLARTDPEDWHLTGTRMAVGTPRYMAPEQMLAGASPDHRADLYALGVVFYELLTGTIPAGNFDPPSGVRKGVSRDVDSVVLRAMHADPATRYQSATEIREDVESITRGRRPRHAVPHSPVLPVVLAAVLAAGLSGAGVWYFLARPDKTKSSQESAAAPQAAAGRLTVIGEAPAGMPSGPMIHLAMGGWERPCGYAVLPDGSVRAWGDNSYGQTSLPPGLPPARSVAAPAGSRGRHALALLTDGTVAGWGDNSYSGQATPPGGLHSAVSVVAGDYFSAALTAAGEVRTWGQFPLPAALTGVQSLAASARSLVVLHRDGTLQTAPPDSLLAAATPPGGGFTAIAAGESHALALTTEGRVIAWGDNQSGECNVPRNLHATRVFAGQHTSAALTTDGQLISWGGFTQRSPAPDGVLSVTVSDDGLLVLTRP